jgi:soluble lytic murein transglycosylase-like protein
MRALLLVLLVAILVSAAAPSWFVVRLRPGDTLWALAHRYHTSVAALIRLNRVPGDGDLIYAGNRLRVPDHTGRHPRQHRRHRQEHHRRQHPQRHRHHHRRHQAHRRRRHASRHIRWRLYRVRPGDSLFRLAARLHVSWTRLARLNGLRPPFVIDVGRLLRIGTAPRRRAHGSPLQRAVAYHRWLLSREGVPPAWRVRQMLVATARRFGLDPALALGIAWQESGFNQREVSPADAIGIMQVLPSTADFVAADIVHRRLNVMRAVDDITAGVALLALLRHEASLRQTVAGYYQGLWSVRHYGMLPSTRQYVRDVLALRSYFARHG